MAGGASKDKQAEELMRQMKGLGDYAQRCGKGYEQLNGYLNSLYSDLDGLMNIPMDAEEAKKIAGAHAGYKSGLKTAIDGISKHSQLAETVKKALSGSIGSEEEAKNVMSIIDKTYHSIIGGVINIYQLIHPEIEVPINEVPIKSVYYNAAKIKKIDIKSKFEKGLRVLRENYFNKDVEDFIKQQQKKAA